MDHTVLASIANINESTNVAETSTAGLNTDVQAGEIVPAKESFAPPSFSYFPLQPTLNTKYLERPIMVTGTWSTSATAGPISFGSLLNTWENDPNIRPRLLQACWYSFKTAHLKILVNGTPMNFGYAKFLVYPFLNPSSSTNFNFASYYPSLMNAFVSPFTVDIDPAVVCESNISVPYLFPNTINPILDTVTTGRDTLNNVGFHGDLNAYLYVIVPLANVSGTLSNVQITFSFWLEDVQLRGFVPYQAQSSEAKSSTIISSSLAKASKIAGMLSEIPVIGPYATSFSWFTALGSKVARALGYSKPLVEDTNEIIPRNYPTYTTVTEGRFYGNNMSSASHTERAIAASMIGVGADDDMDFSKIISKYGIFNFLQVTSAMTNGTVIGYNTIHPGLVYVEPAVTNTYSLPPLCHVAGNFTYWRGTMTVRIHVVASTFQRCTILVCTYPTSSSISNPSMENSVVNCTNQLIQVSGHSWTEIPIPFYSNGSVYNEVFVAGPSGLPVINYVGTAIALFVMTPLTSSQTNNPPISLILEVKGEQDFEFAYPNSTNLADYSPYWQAQSSDAASLKIVDDFGINFVTFGEKFLSFKALIAKPYIKHRLYWTAAGNTCPVPFFNIDPYRNSIASSSAQSWVAAPYSTPLDICTWGFWAQTGGKRFSFAFDSAVPCRPSLQLRTRYDGISSMLTTSGSASNYLYQTTAPQPSSSNKLVSSSDYAYESWPYTMPAQYTSMSSTYISNGTATAYSNVSPLLNVEVPWCLPFSFVPAGLAGWAKTASTGPTGIKVVDPFSAIYLQLTMLYVGTSDTPPVVNCAVFESAAEDTKFFLYMGTPLLILHT